MSNKVLLVDDEASVRRSLSLNLLQKGYDTIPCENGMKALSTLEVLKKNNVLLDYAVIDYLLPDIDGIKLLRVLKVKYPSLPVILITAYGSEIIKGGESVDGFLDKPFDIDDLTTIFSKIDEKISKRKEKLVDTGVVSDYVLVRFSKEADIVSTYRDLYFMDGVLYCDAIRGHYDLILLIQGKNRSELKKMEEILSATDGVIAVSSLQIEMPLLGEPIIEAMASVDDVLSNGSTKDNTLALRDINRSASSYVFLEIEPEKIEAIYPILYFNDNVVSCDYTKGCFDIVLLVKGTSFSDIDRVINQHFKSLDGVIRVKECPMIRIFNL
jgi:CheY-like chemotaxis protein